MNKEIIRIGQVGIRFLLEAAETNGSLAVFEFTVPAGLLKPGEFYVWSVTALNGGDAGTKCRALVRVLLADERAEVERLEKETADAGAAAPDNPAPTLLLAQVYERLGMYDDALAAYEAARKLRPDDPGIQSALKHLTGTD